MPAEDGSVFYFASGAKGADCAAPHKNIFVKVERENKMSKITRRNFLKVSGVAAAAAALTACGGSSSTASSAASGAASSEAASTAAKLDKIKVAVPNDTTNEARALQLLATQGLITVRDDAGLTATINDITETVSYTHLNAADEL